MAVLMAGLLVVVGGGAALLVAANPLAVGLNATLDSTPRYNLTVQVGAVVEGREIPIIGAEVSVWSCSVNKTNDSVVITFSRVGHDFTEVGGNVTFNLPAGQYYVIANYSGLKSFKQISLESDLSIVAQLHNYHHGDDDRLCASHHERHEWGGDDEDDE